MNYRQFHITDAQKNEIVEFDVLYRINAQKNGEASVLLNRANEWLEPKFQELLNDGLLEINDRDSFALSETGKSKLQSYGVMFKRFKDLSIFKCVYPDAPPPEHEGEPDQRFGAYSEEANPPHSEDYRVLIFENFCQREKRQAPLHLFAFFSLIENLRPNDSEEDWVWALSTGELFTRIESAINSQPNAESICPEGWTEDEIIDEIYKAGMAERQRCFKNDQDKMSPDTLQQDQQDFWVEEITETIEDDRHEMMHDPYYYDPRPSYGSAILVGAFAGLATCAILS